MNSVSIHKGLLLSLALVTTQAFSQRPVPGQTERIRKPSSYVDPFIGTDGFGHTYPGASMPFGMVQLSPDTRTSGWENCSGYHSSNPTIIGFSHTHLSGTGASDYGDILFMPNGRLQLEAGDEKAPLTGYRSAFKHETERALPGYYRVMLDDHMIQAELTTTTRAGMHKYTFSQADSMYVILDLQHGISDRAIQCELTVTGNNTVSGYRRSEGWAKDHSVYFYAEFSKPFEVSGTITEKGISGNTAIGTWAKAWFRFGTSDSRSVMVKVGISTVSAENAKLNLLTEIPAWDFMGVKNAAATAWDKEIGRVVVEGDNEDDKTVFYTALYHCLLSPNIMSDVDGRYRGMDGTIRKMDRGNMYSVFSLWDTFRALHPLFTMIDPERAQDLVRALLRKYEEYKLLPVWELASNETGCMIGYHSVPVIADAYFKGLRDFDTGLAFEAAKVSAMQDHLGLKYYKKLGYIPADRENESVSKTLEYAYDDWCIARMAADMGKQSDAAVFSKRAKNYQNVYDASSGFMRGKKNGNWFQPFDPFEVSGLYTEANAWQYTFFVPHDINGMTAMMGGKNIFTQRLDSLFGTKTELTGRSQPDISGMIGQYAHGNEPSHHMAYLYMFTDQRHRTAELTRKIMKELYHTKRDGLSGNEDCGQMSAWYVFSALGFYPVTPGVDYYVYGTPLFKKAVITPGNGNSFTITATSASENAIYPARILLNGKTTMTFIRNSDILSGGSLSYELSDKKEIPDYKPATAPWNYNMAMVPYLVSGPRAFIDSCNVSLHTFTPGGTVYYTTDSTLAPAQWKKFTEPFVLTQSSTVYARTVSANVEPSFTESVSFIRLPYKRSISYTHPYSHLYTAGGVNGLIDGIRGEPEVFGSWQGFQGTDLEAVVDLGEVRAIDGITTGFLQQYPSWIWLPLSVRYELSDDGITYRSVYQKNTSDADDVPGSFVRNYESNNLKEKARYVRVTAVNRKTCPEWHPGAGYPAWIFVDEIEIR